MEDSTAIAGALTALDHRRLRQKEAPVNEPLNAIDSDAVLLHVGMPKTGTTALQNVAAARRDDLLAHGVRYPGKKQNHSAAVFSLMGRRPGWADGPGRPGAPSIKRWAQLVREVHAETERRVLISHEFLGEMRPFQIERVMAEIDRPIRVVMAVRALPSLLSSSWQQFLKNGMEASFDEWLDSVLNDPGPSRLTPIFARRLDVATNIEQWSSAVGSENFTLIVLDPNDRGLLTRTFEQLLALPDRFLNPQWLSGGQQNRSFSLPEAEFLRSMSAALKTFDGMTWPHYKSLIKFGAMERVLRNRVPAAAEPKIVAPAWAIDDVVERAHQQIQRIHDSQVTIVGSLDGLARTPKDSTPHPWDPSRLPTDIAEEAVLGVVSAAMGRGPLFSPDLGTPAPALAPPEPPVAPEPEPVVVRTVAQATRGISTRDLTLTVLRRVRRRAARLVSRTIPDTPRSGRHV